MSDQFSTTRPRIETVYPVTGYAVLGFGVLNVFLGVSLYLLPIPSNSQLNILTYILNYQIWGVLFLLSGVMLLYSLAVNNWDRMRQWLLITLFFKLVWIVALIYFFVVGHFRDAIILSLWGFITHVQLLIYLYFVPPIPEGMGQGREHE